LPRVKFHAKDTYRGYPVNQSRERKGLYVSILNKIINQTEAMLSHHYQVLAIRFDLRYPEGFTPEQDDNEYIKAFFKSLKKRLEKKKWRIEKAITRAAYVWVREVSTDKGSHFHCCLILNAKHIDRCLVRDPLYAELNSAWCSAIGDPAQVLEGKHLVELVDNGNRKTHFKSDDQQSINDFVYHCSYMAKSRTKPKDEPIFNGSRIPAKSK